MNHIGPPDSALLRYVLRVEIYGATFVLLWLKFVLRTDSFPEHFRHIVYLLRNNLLGWDENFHFQLGFSGNGNDSVSVISCIFDSRIWF